MNKSGRRYVKWNKAHTGRQVPGDFTICGIQNHWSHRNRVEWWLPEVRTIRGLPKK
jgi:hypothetical protein